MDGQDCQLYSMGGIRQGQHHRVAAFHSDSQFSPLNLSKISTLIAEVGDSAA